MNVTTLGIDLAKNTFSLHGVDAHGKTVSRKTLSRAKLMPFLAQQPPCLIGLYHIPDILEFAAWLGLTPRQYTTGGKIRSGRITKQGDAYLRTLLIHGTRAVLATLGDKQDRLSVWHTRTHRTAWLQARHGGPGRQECTHPVGADGAR